MEWRWGVRPSGSRSGFLPPQGSAATAAVLLSSFQQAALACAVGTCDPRLCNHNLSRHTVCLRESSGSRACVLGLVGFSPEDPQAVAPMCCRGSLWLKCTFVGCVSEAVCYFIKEERKVVRETRGGAGVNSLNITAQILASMPRFLINVILLGFRNLEMTE